jgi:hypothetical protein
VREDGYGLFYDDSGKCKFLEREGPRYLCSLMLRQDIVGAKARAENGLGMGCIVASSE